jgi:hypothetical protein
MINFRWRYYLESFPGATDLTADFQVELVGQVDVCAE